MDEHEKLTRSDMALVRQALRQDWPVAPEIKRMMLQRMIDYVDRDHEDGATAPDRTVIMAARTIATFCGLTLRQQALDLAREKLDGETSGDLGPAGLVEEAERRAEERRRERERAAD